MATLRLVTSLSGVSRRSCAYSKMYAMRSTRILPVRFMSTVSPEFERAKDTLGTLKEDPGNEAKLKIYALFKQATSGPVTSKRPGMTNFVGRAKWDAWNALGTMNSADAQKAYIDLVSSLVKTEKTESISQAASDQKYKNLLVKCEDGLRVITLNRPSKKNAVTVEMYSEWMAALAEATADPNTVITAITGAGDFYCAGNDLTNFTNVKPEDIHKMAQDSKVMLRRFVAAFIDFPKPLIAVVNGPSFGISVTTLALCDAVYASDRATFTTPFSKLGQSPEGCSSYLFPKLMGQSKACQFLMFNKTITAHEAQELGLVTKVIPDAMLQSEVWPELRKYAKLPIKSLVYTKALTRETEKDILHKINESECETISERWTSEDCINAVMNFVSRNT
ncbi:Enoyl-CoA delta isomerase 2, mitochondrial [Halocaridina rubra]|uniref:Enoyl-CoA delta isomerase 2, mitochondrial n=1 Tax=Halocaridina rubra TaxID=373956 RepID=A0AAN8XII6_HALRR